MCTPFPSFGPAHARYTQAGGAREGGGRERDEIKRTVARAHLPLAHSLANTECRGEP